MDSCITSYVEDWLLMASARAECNQFTNFVTTLFRQLQLDINLKKSSLEPSQTVSYLQTADIWTTRDGTSSSGEASHDSEVDELTAGKSKDRTCTRSECGADSWQNNGCNNGDISCSHDAEVGLQRHRRSQHLEFRRVLIQPSSRRPPPILRKNTELEGQLPDNTRSRHNHSNGYLRLRTGNVHVQQHVCKRFLASPS